MFAGMELAVESGILDPDDAITGLYVFSSEEPLFKVSSDSMCIRSQLMF